MSPTDVLRRAKARIADPARWCQGALASDPMRGADESVAPTAPEACAWCALGAVCAEVGAEELSQTYGTVGGHAIMYLNAAAGEMYGRALPDFADVAELNDEESHATVMHMFDLAVALAEEVGS